MRPDVVAVDIDNGAYILDTAALANATATATIAGTHFIAGDQVSLTINNTAIPGLPATVTYTLGSGETATTIAAGLTALINANAALQAAHLSATSVGAVITVSQAGSIGNTTTLWIASFFVPVAIAKVIAIGASFVLNFSLSHFVVFRRRPTDDGRKSPEGEGAAFP